MRCSKIKCGKKRMKEISEMREEKKMSECKGGGVQQVLRGVQKIKGRSRKEGARMGLWTLGWAGSTHGLWVGSGESI